MTQNPLVMVAVYNRDTSQRIGAMRWHLPSGQFVLEPEAKAHRFTDRAEAQQLTDDFNDYWTTKGRAMRAHVEPMTEQNPT